MRKTILSFLSMAFICAMTFTSCREFMSSLDNPVDSYLQVDGPELFVAEGSSIEVACATISDGDVTFTVADAKVAKVEKVEPHMAKVTGLKVGETDVIVKLAATEYYKAAEAKVKIIVKPTYSLKDAVVDGAKLKIGYKFNGEDCLFAYAYDAEKKVFNALEENSVPQEITDLYEVSITYDGEGQITQKLVSKENEALVPFVLNLYTGGSFDRVFTKPVEMKSVVVNNYNVLPYTEESVTPIADLQAAQLPAEMSTGDKGSFAVTGVTPQNATNQVIKYTSSDPNVITIDAAGNFECVAAGTATIKAEATDGSGKFVEQEITTKAVLATGITLSKTETIINYWSATPTETLTATVTPDNASNKNVTWSSDNEAVATVNATTGEITSVAPGTANITARTTDGTDLTKTCTVTVYNNYLQTPGRGTTVYMTFGENAPTHSGTIYFKGKVTTSSDSNSIAYRHYTYGSFDRLSFNGVQFYNGSWAVPAALYISGGTGTENDPYVLSTP
jgi:hypothetical protein